MKKLYCRDDDGTPSVWEKEAESTVSKVNGCWNSLRANAKLISDGFDETEKIFGPGFHGVKKGRKQIVELTEKK